MTEKVIGYCLLIVGVFLILFSAANVFAVFTKRAEPIKLFQTSGVSLDLNQLLTGSLPPELSRSLPVQSKAQSTEIISADLINQSSNLIFHIVFMGFIAGTGQKLASIGVELIRPIVVKSKEEKQ